MENKFVSNRVQAFFDSTEARIRRYQSGDHGSHILLAVSNDSRFGEIRQSWRTIQFGQCINRTGVHSEEYASHTGFRFREGSFDGIDELLSSLAQATIWKG